MKGDVNLNSRLNAGCDVIHSRRFQMMTKRTVPGACATIASKGLYEHFIQFKK